MVGYLRGSGEGGCCCLADVKAVGAVRWCSARGGVLTWQWRGRSLSLGGVTVLVGAYVAVVRAIVVVRRCSAGGGRLRRSGGADCGRLVVKRQRWVLTWHLNGL